MRTTQNTQFLAALETHVAYCTLIFIVRFSVPCFRRQCVYPALSFHPPSFCCHITDTLAKFQQRVVVQIVNVNIFYVIVALSGSLLLFCS